MKKDNKFLLIGLSATFLAFLSFYTIPKATIFLNILILIGGISIASGAIIRMYKTFKWLKSDEKSSTNMKDK